ncbi:MAG: hypothetical protein FJ390_07935 [Verrucomicrobia bacterium]|nr:hypothetical protein [Verrucomicrobiota bacterium]
MNSISPATSVVGNQIPIPASSVNQPAPSNPAADLDTQKNLAEATNAGTATSNAITSGESALQGILANLNLSPTTKA